MCPLLLLQGGATRLHLGAHARGPEHRRPEQMLREALLIRGGSVLGTVDHDDPVTNPDLPRAA